MKFKKSLNEKKRKNKAFTLVELIIVIAIIGMIVLIAMPKFGNVQKVAKINADIASAKTIANAATTKVAKGESVENIKDITDEIQGKIPEPKMEPSSGTKGFTISKDSDGNFIVKNGDDQVYPRVDSKDGVYGEGK